MGVREKNAWAMLVIAVVGVHSRISRCCWSASRASH